MKSDCDALTELQLVDLGVNAHEGCRRLLPAARREKALCAGGQTAGKRVGGANARLIRSEAGLYQPSQSDRPCEMIVHRTEPRSKLFRHGRLHHVEILLLSFKVRPGAISRPWALRVLCSHCPHSFGHIRRPTPIDRRSRSSRVGQPSHLSLRAVGRNGHRRQRNDNDLRHLHHSCQPNCEAVERWGDDGLLQLDIVALRAIAEGEELFIDYALEIDESNPAEYPCTCLLLDAEVPWPPSINVKLPRVDSPARRSVFQLSVSSPYHVGQIQDQRQRGDHLRSRRSGTLGGAAANMGGRRASSREWKSGQTPMGKRNRMRGDRKSVRHTSRRHGYYSAPRRGPR